MVDVRRHEDEAAGRPEDSRYFSEHLDRCLEMLEHHVRRHEIEAAVGKRESIAVGHDGTRQGWIETQVIRLEVAADDYRSAVGQLGRGHTAPALMNAVPCADVEPLNAGGDYVIELARIPVLVKLYGVSQGGDYIVVRLHA